MPLYFAYGSNMDRAAMAQRCPKSTVVAERNEVPDTCVPPAASRNPASMNMAQRPSLMPADPS